MRILKRSRKKWIKLLKKKKHTVGLRLSNHEIARRKEEMEGAKGGVGKEKREMEG